MADDPRKKGADGKRVSQQPHEQEYQRRKQRTSTGSGRSESTESNSSEDSSSMEKGRSGNRSESTGRSGSNGGRWLLIIRRVEGRGEILPGSFNPLIF